MKSAFSIHFAMRCILCGLVASVAASLLVLLPAFGQDPAPIEIPSGQSAPAPANQPRKKVIYREKSYFEFEDTLINGNLRAPDGSFIFRKSQSTFSSALNLRRSFIPELKQSADDAR